MTQSMGPRPAGASPDCEDAKADEVLGTNSSTGTRLSSDTPVWEDGHTGRRFVLSFPSGKSVDSLVRLAGTRTALRLTERAPPNFKRRCKVAHVALGTCW